MKILLVHNTYQQRGGEDSVFEAEIKLLSEKGHTIEKMVFDNHSIESVCDKFLTGIGTIYNSRSGKKIVELIQHFSPDVIHVHNFFPLVSPAVFYVAKRKQIPIVITLHNYRLICANGLLLRKEQVCEDCTNKILPLDGILHKCYRDSFFQSAAVTLMSSVHKLSGTWKNYIDCYIALTKFAKEKFIDSALKLVPEKVVVKPNFVSDPGEYKGEREDYFLFVGRLSEEKGIRILLDAFKEGKLKLKIIGDGPLKKMVKDFSLQHPNIEFLGFREKSYVINTMEKSMALIFPSLWYEGFPVTIAEAMATGTPVISSNIGSQGEIIADNFNGLLFQCGNLKDLNEKISFFYSNVAHLKHLYLNARNSYLENYNPDKNYETLMNIYKHVIANYGTKRNN